MLLIRYFSIQYLVLYIDIINMISGNSVTRHAYNSNVGMAADQVNIEVLQKKRRQVYLFILRREGSNVPSLAMDVS